jgi:hypothetical protein
MWVVSSCLAVLLTTVPADLSDQYPAYFRGIRAALFHMMQDEPHETIAAAIPWYQSVSRVMTRSRGSLFFWPRLPLYDPFPTRKKILQKLAFVHNL